MPYYVVENTETKEVQPLPLMTWNQVQKFLADNPTYKLAPTAPAQVKVN